MTLLAPTFHYFGYGSNLDLASLRAKGVQPVSSSRGVIVGWRPVCHLRRLDTSDGMEEDVAGDERTPAQQGYLNTFLRSDAEEYTYVGRLVAES